jgi:predicted DCC family thiol-disulfide oxidoreductase YuxK
MERHGLASAGLDSVVLIAGGHVATKSTAALRIARRLGGVWALLAIPGFLVPRRLGDALYDAVARNRLRWFGRADPCRVRTPAESARFLDQPAEGARSAADTGSR